MEPIADYLKKRVKDEGAARWEEMAQILNRRLPADDQVTFHSLRKIAYGERPNLGLRVAQALIDFFREQDRKADRKKNKAEKAGA